MSEIGINTAGSFIGNEASSIIELVITRIRKEIRRSTNLTRDGGALDELCEELGTLKSMVSVASGKPITNTAFLYWVTKFENIAYDADDMLDEWSYAQLKRDIKIKGPIQRLNGAVNYGIFRLTTAQKVDNLLRSIEAVKDGAKSDGIKVVKVSGGERYDPATKGQSQENEQRLYTEQETVYGRKGDFDDIVGQLERTSNCHQKLNVIGIVGMGGVGKTTLSNKVSKSSEVKKLFDVVISVVVASYDNDNGLINSIMKKIAIKLLGSIGKSDDITSKLQQQLSEKKYLLILDDVWNPIHWDTLRNALLEIGGSEGTTILVTSRENEVVRTMSTHGAPHIHTLQGLSEPDSWSFFTNRLSISFEQLDSERQDTAKRIIKKCGGNPLAIRVLGDLLRDSDLEKLREVGESKEWTDDSRANVLAILRLSYSHLSSTWKSCFSYCAVFEEDELIDKDRLIWLWMAQGLLLSKDADAEMEVEGEKCFKGLLNSSLFHEPEFDGLGNVVYVKMHDLVRDLACIISKKKNGGEASGSSGSVVRHMSVSVMDDFESHLARSKMMRTCLFKQYEILRPNILKNFEKLRALSFSFSSNSKRKDWKPLGKLKHLRFLEITIGIFDNEGVLDILPQIAKLYHMQTLVLPYFALPKSFGNLGIMPGLGHLKNLRTLPSIDLCKNCGGRISELQNLNKLRGTLSISDINRIQDIEEACSVELGAKSSLKALKLSNDDLMRNPNEILQALTPPGCLKELEMHSLKVTTRFPTWLTSTEGSSLSSLERLTLTGCEKANELNIGNFKSLRCLILTRCYELTLVFPVDGFQCCKLLERLEIQDCYKVDSLPNLSPLTKLRTLLIEDIGITAKATRSKLEGLDYLHCKHMRTHGYLLPETLSQDSSICKSLKVLTITCHDNDVESLPPQLKHFVALQHLAVVGYKGLKTLSDECLWRNMTSLEELTLDSMPELERLPSASTWDRLSTLKRIYIIGCPLLRGYDPSVHERWNGKIHFF